MKSLFEQNVGTYSAHGDYSIPNLALPESSDYQIGIWGQRRLDYLKKHRRVFYINLLTSGKLAEHLQEVDVTAQKRWETIAGQMVRVQGVTEQFKAEHQMEWVGRMNNIHACANKIILTEMIYS